MFNIESNSKSCCSLISGDQAFAVAAPHHWNTLPVGLSKSDLVDAFEKGLKSYVYLSRTLIEDN